MEHGKGGMELAEAIEAHKQALKEHEEACERYLGNKGSYSETVNTYLKTFAAFEDRWKAIQNERVIDHGESRSLRNDAKNGQRRSMGNVQLRQRADSLRRYVRRIYRKENRGDN